MSALEVGYSTLCAIQIYVYFTLLYHQPVSELARALLNFK